MKIAEFIKKNEETLPPMLAEILNNEHSIWSNDACYGYVIAAMENAGYSRDQIRDLLPYLHSAFENYFVEEAEQKYTNW